MKIEGLDRILAGHRLFAGLDPEIVALFSGCAANAVFRPGALVARHGDPADTIYLIREGHVALEIGSPGHGRLRVQTIGPDEVLGLSWLVPPYVWSYDAEALDEVRAITIDAACLRAKCEADPAIGYELMKRFMPPIVERLQATRLQMLDVYGTRR